MSASLDCGRYVDLRASGEGAAYLLFLLIAVLKSGCSGLESGMEPLMPVLRYSGIQVPPTLCPSTSDVERLISLAFFCFAGFVIRIRPDFLPHMLQLV